LGWLLWGLVVVRVVGVGWLFFFKQKAAYEITV